ncbi:MAG: hypothetical protein M1127_01050 [Patescibacteria group bacterium]|nr:hypothetical protein [Patescibacteria group bacterium]
MDKQRAIRLKSADKKTSKNKSERLYRAIKSVLRFLSTGYQQAEYPKML